MVRVNVAVTGFLAFEIFFLPGISSVYYLALHFPLLITHLSLAHLSRRCYEVGSKARAIHLAAKLSSAELSELNRDIKNHSYPNSPNSFRNFTSCADKETS